jgi:hypothetical protein
MFKIQIEWTLTNGKSFEEWTIPWEIATAEKETGTSFIKQFKEELPPSLEQQFWLAYQMQRRLSDKPVGRFEDWRSSVVHINAKDFETTNFTKPEASPEQ